MTDALPPHDRGLISPLSCAQLQRHVAVLALRELGSGGAVGAGAIAVDHEPPSITVDRALLDLLGITEHAFHEADDSMIDRVHPHDREALCTALTGTAEPLRLRFRFDVQADGSHRWFEVRLDPLDAHPRRLTGLIVDVDDLVSEHIRVTDELADLARSHSFQQAVIAATPDAMHIYDIASGALSRVLNPGPPLHDFHADSVDVINGHRVSELVPRSDAIRLKRAFADACVLPDGESSSLRHRVTGIDNHTAWLRRRISVLDRDSEGAATTLVVVSSEITEIVVVEQRLKHAAEHDDLIGLPNRRKLAADLGRRLAAGRSTAVIALNLDGFRPVNDLHGRDAGDSVLTAVAQRLVSAVRTSDMVARIAGDEFVMLISTDLTDSSPDGNDDLDLTTEMHVDQIARRVGQLLSEPFHLAEAEVTLSARAGICLGRSDEDGTDSDAERMIAAANAAMDWVRRSGGSGHYVFDQVLRDELRSLENIERNLRRALRDDALEVYYQPIVAPHSGTIYSVEALVRLRDEQGRMLPVDQVIAVAERCSLVAELDDQMLAKACSQVARWRREPRFANLRLALNRSAKDLNRPGFHNRIMRRLAESDLPADALTLEITETVLLHVTASRVDEMTRLHNSLVSLAIDDFGTGYASMSQLIALPISAIKIDRSFTARILEDPTCAALVRASVRIASDLGLSCVVEGVETIEQLRALPSYDRLLVQGYLYGRPRVAEQALDIRVASLN